jgi:UDP-glucose 4-epimerase
MFDEKTILVTGGTGSFGNNFVRLLLKEHNPREIVVYSRDEKKQYDMRNSLNDSRLSFVIGDVRDREQVRAAMKAVDYVFHAAALKQVPSCEFFPMEAVLTNVVGTHHVISAAEECGVEKLVVLSTDKAVYPINAMGQTKAIMEKLILARARAPHVETTFCGVRYGNVMCSRGSVIPLFINQIKAGQPLTITDPEMTRLLLPLSEAVRLVIFAMREGRQGDIFVRKAQTAGIGDLAQALLNLFDADLEMKIVGVRAGEKQHEVLVTAEELSRAEEFDEYYRVACRCDRDYNKFFTNGVEPSKYTEEGYTSANARRLSVREIEQLLLSLPQVTRELESWRPAKLRIRRAA